MDPNVSDAYTEMGLIHQFRGEIIQAVVSYNRALSLNPNNKITQLGADDLVNEHF